MLENSQERGSSLATSGAPNMFSLRVTNASDGSVVCEALQVSGTHTVRQLKARLLAHGLVSTRALRIHVCHGGRLLSKDDALDVMREHPVAVLAVLMPPPPATAPPPDAMLPPRQLPGAAAVAAAPRARAPLLGLPSREMVAAVWEAAFPSGDDGAAPATSAALPGSQADVATAPAEGEAGEEERLCRCGAECSILRTLGGAFARARPPYHRAVPCRPPRACTSASRLGRVCFCGTEGGPLIAPCRCRGTMALVHERCLNEWRAASANPRSFERCDQCGFAYCTERTAAAAWLQSEITVRAVAVVAFTALVVACALVPLPAEVVLYRLLHWQPAFSPYTRRWWGPYCDRLVRGLIMPAALGVAESVHAARARHRGLPLAEQGWLWALVISLAGEGSLLVRPLLVGGICYFAAHAQRRARGVCRRLLAQHGERVLDLALVNMRSRGRGR